MKVKRIATMPTFKKYEEDIRAMIPKYLRKSGCLDEPEDIINQIRYGCNDPYYYSFVVLDEDVPKGFMVVYMMVHKLGKRIIVDHLYAPNMNMAGKIYSGVVNKISEDFGVDSEMVWFVTYRNPEAWIKFSDKEGYPMNIQSYILRRERRRKY